jgi:hypothetical protein
LEKISQENAKVLIFVGTKRTADDLTKYLRQDGWPALAIHGDKQQQERDWVLGEFKSGRSPIMIATDVASRGLGRKISLLNRFPFLARWFHSIKRLGFEIVLRSAIELSVMKHRAGSKGIREESLWFCLRGKG